MKTWSEVTATVKVIALETHNDGHPVVTVKFDRGEDTIRFHLPSDHAIPELGARLELTVRPIGSP